MFYRLRIICDAYPQIVRTFFCVCSLVLFYVHKPLKASCAPPLHLCRGVLFYISTTYILWITSSPLRVASSGSHGVPRHEFWWMWLPSAMFSQPSFIHCHSLCTFGGHMLANPFARTYSAAKTHDQPPQTNHRRAAFTSHNLQPRTDSLQRTSHVVAGSARSRSLLLYTNQFIAYIPDIRQFREPKFAS